MFDTDEAPERADVWPQPGEVWSLWEMLRAYAHEFNLVDRYLTQALRVCPQNNAQAEGFTNTNGKPWHEWVRGELEWVGRALEKLPVGAGVIKQFDRTLKSLDPTAGGSYQDVEAHIEQLRSRMRDELEELQFLHVTPRLSIGLGEAAPFGASVEQAFPSASLEIRDAARCLAFGQGTAAVFHCMRALEPALIAFATEFDVEYRENWNSLLNAIEAAVRDRKNSKEWENWRDAETYFAEACTHFFFIKNAWRNHTMHLNLRFSEQDALPVYEHTRAFMQHLATNLSEDVEGASPEQSA